MAVTMHEVFAQRYAGNDCAFEFGLVDGHPVDTIYAQWEKGGAEPYQILLRRDEALIIIHGLSAALWSEEIAKVTP